MRRRIFALVLALALVMLLLPGAQAAGSAIEDVQLECEVTCKGHKMKVFTLTVKDAAILEGITAQDFVITGLATQWGTQDLHAFRADIGAVAVEDNTLRLTVINFNEKYFYVDSFNVTCTNARLSFTHEDLSRVFTPVADDFLRYRMADGADFDYNIFEPAAADGPLPVVIANHGMGDFVNLLQNRVATAYAEPYNQSVRPCYVIAPLYGNEVTGEYYDTAEVFAKTVALVQQLIDEGKVDEKRVYVTGKSMGGSNTINMMLAYPDLFAAGLPMCGSYAYANYDPEKQDITPLLNIPILLADCDGDSSYMVAGHQKLYAALKDAGGEKIYARMFTMKEMNVLGYDEYHAVDIMINSSEMFAMWLFSNVKE